MIVILANILQNRPLPLELHGIRVRAFRGELDVADWLHIRNQAFAGQTAGTRPWREKDFYREFRDKPGWRPEWMWFSESLEGETPRLVGAVAMTPAERRGRPAVSVSWLAVLPDWRRRGVGRQLMAVLEAAAWDAERRLVLVETLSDWAPAMRFYQTLGYSPAAALE